MVRVVRDLYTIEQVDAALQEHWAWLRERRLLAS
jgi:hypothetical protein